MRKLLYNTIKETLLSMLDENEQPVIKHVDLWNQQTVLPEEEQAFDTPAVFIEFGNIQWRPLQRGVREAEVQIGLHVVTDSRVGSWDDAIHVFELLDDINKKLHCLHTTEGVRTMDSLTLVQSQTDNEFDELMDNIETYSCHVTDATAYPFTSMSSKNITFEVGAEVQHPTTT